MAQSVYQNQLDKIISELDENCISQNSDKPTLLMHACCGPCSSYVLEYLSCYFNITIFYYNPNIYPQEEYFRRLNELKTFYTKFPPAANVQVVEEVYNPEDFYQAVGTREEPELAVEPEKGERCRRCYLFRLEKAFDYACKNHFDYFCTTLSISPFKDAEKINVIGQNLTASRRADNPTAFISNWLPSDFKKKGGFKRSLELSSEYNLYRQQYCGCVYSKNNK